MKIALISPKGPLYRHKGGIFGKSLRYQPLTLPTLAALVPDDLCASISIYDEGIEDVPLDLEVDLVGITVITGNAKRAYELSAHFKKLGACVVLGGPHVTLLPEEAALHADSICVGYAEDIWPQLLRDFHDGKLQPAYRQSPDFTLMRAMPYPKRELMDRKHFLTQHVFEATRSCVHDCEFCVAPSAWGKKQYQKPIDWIVGDIKRMGSRKLLFVDLNLVSDVEYAKELFTALIPLNVKWFGLTTVMIAHDRELMELMARSGCHGLLLGLETISDGSLRDAQKDFNSSVDYIRLIDDLHALKIAIQGCFVFGLDHDTKDTFERTAEFAIDTGVDLPRFAIVTPFPGTPLYRRLDAEGRILTKNWELYDGQHVVFQPSNMTCDELRLGHERVWKKVYSYSGIWRRLGHSKKFDFLIAGANMGYRYYAHQLDRFYNCDVPLARSDFFSPSREVERG